MASPLVKIYAGLFLKLDCGFHCCVLAHGMQVLPRSILAKSMLKKLLDHPGVHSAANNCRCWSYICFTYISSISSMYYWSPYGPVHVMYMNVDHTTQNINHMSSFLCSGHQFLSVKISAKAKLWHSWKFAPYKSILHLLVATTTGCKECDD